MLVKNISPILMIGNTIKSEDGASTPVTGALYHPPESFWQKQSVVIEDDICSDRGTKRRLTPINKFKCPDEPRMWGISDVDNVCKCFEPTSNFRMLPPDSLFEWIHSLTSSLKTANSWPSERGFILWAEFPFC